MKQLRQAFTDLKVPKGTLFDFVKKKKKVVVDEKRLSQLTGFSLMDSVNPIKA